jgi:hypothetical protein
VTPAKLADAVAVDPKTIERWIVGGRVPYRRHRYAVAAFFGVDESYIWPDALDRDEIATASESEIIAVYPHRWAVPREAWGHLFEQASQEIGILVYSGYFMAEDARRACRRTPAILGGQVTVARRIDYYDEDRAEVPYPAVASCHWPLTGSWKITQTATP